MNARRSPTRVGVEHRLRAGVAAISLGIVATACGGADAAEPPVCAGDRFAVGDGWVSPMGTGRSQSDSYVVETILFDDADGERLVMENFSGAVHSLPGAAMNGYLVFDGHRVDLVEADVTPPEGRIGPCFRLAATELPPDWEPPSADDHSGGH